MYIISSSSANREQLTVAYTTPEGMPGRVNHTIGIHFRPIIFKIPIRLSNRLLFSWCLFFRNIIRSFTFYRHQQLRYDIFAPRARPAKTSRYSPVHTELSL